jgi:uncharacterized protein with GYD domain
MAHYLFRASYTQSGVQGVIKEGGTARLAVVERLVASMGGRLETAYWAFGSDDFIAIAELPGNEAAAAVALTVSASGAVGVTTTVLLTAAEIDAAVGRKPEYRAPGA